MSEFWAWFLGIAGAMGTGISGIFVGIARARKLNAEALATIIAELRAERVDMRQEMTALRQELRTVRNQNVEQATEMEALTRRNIALTREVAALHAEVDALKKLTITTK